MPKLIITDGEKKMEEVTLARGTINIGRLSDNDIQIKDTTVSAHHAKIVTFFKPTYIKDLISTNGSYVNGKQIQEHTLEHGDVITIGQHHIIFDKGDEKAAGNEPEMTQSLSLNDIEQVLKYAAIRSGLSLKDKAAPSQ